MAGFFQNIKPSFRKFIRDSFWSFIASGLSKGGTFVSLIIVVRILGLSEFGKLSLIQSTLELIQVTTTLGLGMAVIPTIAGYRNNEPERLLSLIQMIICLSIGLSLIGLLSLLSASSYISREFLKNSELAQLFRAVAFLLPISMCNSIQNSILTGFELFSERAKVTAFTGLITFIAQVYGAYMLGVKGYFLGSAISGLIEIVANHVVIRKELKKYRTFESSCLLTKLQSIKRELPVFWRIAIPASLGDIVVVPITWSAKMSLASTNNGFIELGVFSAVSQVAAYGMQIIHVLGVPLLPILSSNKFAKNKEKIFLYGFYFFWLLGFLFIFPVIAFPEIIVALFPGKYEDTDAYYKTIVLVFFYTGITAYKKGFANLLLVDGRMWWSFLSNSFWSLSLFLFSTLMIESGAMGLALSFLSAHLLSASIFLPLYWAKGLIPRVSYVSKHSVVIWFCLVFISIISFDFSAFVFVRIFFFIVMIVLMGYSFKQLIADCVGDV